MIEFKITPVSKPRRKRGYINDHVKKYLAFKKEVQLLANIKSYTLGDTLDIVFIIPMPKSWSGKKKNERDGSPHQQRPDVDNLAKAWMDALATEDSHVHSINCKKIWGYEGKIILNSCIKK